jgi:hypothetical protein
VIESRRDVPPGILQKVDLNSPRDRGVAQDECRRRPAGHGGRQQSSRVLGDLRALSFDGGQLVTAGIGHRKRRLAESDLNVGAIIALFRRCRRTKRLQLVNPGNRTYATTRTARTHLS